ncbi:MULTISPECIES: DUF1150 family protein [Pseudophaeobacter]|jgi:hypothetical protein|uniref:DUF1150 family protein n=1 Tax=Pseudophaeobacter TaxID=1541822 RepID=UPI00242B6731|nr:DUF1150 family protein [Pseudophaeobacter profundi]
MQTPFDTNSTGPRIVYVKAVAVSDLPKDVQANAEGRDLLYAVHDSEGEQLAVVTDRKLAFLLARQNDLSPVAVH